MADGTRNSRSKILRSLVLALTSPFVLVACDSGADTPTSPGTPQPPQAAGTPSVAGDWIGDYNPGVRTSPPFMFDPCDATLNWIAANFSQDGSRVTGTFTTSRDNSMTGALVHADVQGGAFNGTLWRARRNDPVRGASNDNAIRFTFRIEGCSDASVTLHRR